MGEPVFCNFWFPDGSIEQVQGELRLFFASDTHPPGLVQEPRITEWNLAVQGPGEVFLGLRVHKIVGPSPPVKAGNARIMLMGLNPLPAHRYW